MISLGKDSLTTAKEDRQSRVWMNSLDLHVLTEQWGEGDVVALIRLGRSTSNT